jgi:hypothetical protein
MTKFRESDKWKSIPSDPTYQLDYFVFVVVPLPTFKTTWHHYFSTVLTSEKRGCRSLFYFYYYKELLDEIKVSINEDFSQNNINDIYKFYDDVLVKWLEFIKYSDDTLYEQNQYFIEMAKLIEEKRNVQR